MNILIINNGYLTTIPSGGDRHLLALGEALATRHAVTFILPAFASHLVDKWARCLRYWSWIPRSVAGIMAAYLMRCFQAIKFAYTQDANVVLASANPVDIIPALINRWRCGSCVVVYPFHLLPDRRGVGVVQRFQYWAAARAQDFALRLMRKADVVFTDNRLVKGDLAAHGIPIDRIHVQRPAVNKAEVERAGAIVSYQVLFIGRIVRSKGVYDLVEALRDVNVSAGIVGEGEDRPAVQKLVVDYGLENRVKVLGPLPFSEMYGLLKGCQLFVFPSYEEGYGIAVAEAIVAGKPVIAYDLPHYAEVFNNSVMTVPKGDVMQLSMRMRDFFDGKIDVGVILKQYSGVQIVDKEGAAALEIGIIQSAIGGVQR